MSFDGVTRELDGPTSRSELRCGHRPASLLAAAFLFSGLASLI